MIIESSLTVLYAAAYLISKQKIKRRSQLSRGAGSILSGIDTNWWIQFGQSSSLQFIVAGALGVLGYWSGLDWGTWGPVATFLIAKGYEEVKKYQQSGK